MTARTVLLGKDSQYRCPDRTALMWQDNQNRKTRKRKQRQPGQSGYENRDMTARIE
jgi:hypothetical protein